MRVARLRFLQLVTARQHGRAPHRGEAVPANFFVYYEVDDDDSKHKLDLEDHGHQEVPNAWVLLEEEA